jgi:hypothetical protein
MGRRKILLRKQEEVATHAQREKNMSLFYDHLLHSFTTIMMMTAVRSYKRVEYPKFFTSLHQPIVFPFP